MSSGRWLHGRNLPGNNAFSEVDGDDARAGRRAVVTLDGGMATEAQIDDSLREATASTPWVVDCGPLAFSPLVS